MAIGILNELQQEIKRLAVAGSSLAYGDFKLKKLLPQLKKMGESAPVFSRIAANLEGLVENSEDSEEKLLELSSLVNAVLYTQGEWEVNGEIEEVDLISTEGTTCLGYRKLKPLIEALTNKGPGRYNLIVEAYNEGIFDKQDRRLIMPIIKALDDSYPDIADFVLERILPKYGMTILPFIRTTFDIKGGKGHGRRLEAVYLIRGIAERELYMEAARNGSFEVKMSAISILKEERTGEDILEELALDKRKEIKTAAEQALAGMKSGIFDRVKSVFKRKD